MRQHGELKLLVLETLGDAGWHYPRQIAAALPFRRRNQLHAYLLRLCDKGLLERAVDRQTVRVIYRLAEQGCRLLLAHRWDERRQANSQGLTHQ